MKANIARSDDEAELQKQGIDVLGQLAERTERGEVEGFTRGVPTRTPSPANCRSRKRRPPTTRNPPKAEPAHIDSGDGAIRKDRALFS